MFERPTVPVWFSVTIQFFWASATWVLLENLVFLLKCKSNDVFLLRGFSLDDGAA